MQFINPKYGKIVELSKDKQWLEIDK
jgi:hypothetical protein